MVVYYAEKLNLLFLYLRHIVFMVINSCRVISIIAMQSALFDV